MLNDFSKLQTFLTVVKEKSFSKASSKLGISQPAVTQQMKYIEDYLDVQIIHRKKNGIKLTKEGEMLFSIAQKIQRCITSSEKDLLKIINKDIPFIFATSSIIGNYIVPKFLNHIKDNIHNDVLIEVSTSEHSINKLLDKKVDMALVEEIIPSDDLIYREWRDDEIVLFSNQKLPLKVSGKDLLKYNWICRPYGSHTREIFKEALEKEDYPNCEDFEIQTEITSSTSIIQTILCSPQDEKPTVSIISKEAIENYVKSKVLFEARVGKQIMKRKLYIVYRKDSKNDAFIDNVVSYLLKVK